MAYTVTRKHSVHGNERAVHLAITADGATENVASGLSVIDAISLGLKSMNSSNIKVNPSAGNLNISGCTSGDAFFVTVFGR